MACTVFEFLPNDAQYQEVKSWYEDPNIEDYKVNGDIWEYRLFHDVPDNWMPGPEDKAAFMSFARYSDKIKWGDDAHKKRKSARMKAEEVALTYMNMLRMGLTRQQMEARVNYIKRSFISRVNQVIEKESAEGREISIALAVRKLGGYASIMRRIFNGYRNTTQQEQYDTLVRRFGEPATDEQKKLLEDKAKYISGWLHKMADNEGRFAKLASRSIADAYGLIIDHTGLEMQLHYDEKEDEKDAGYEDSGTQGEQYVDTRSLKVMDTISTECKVLLSNIPTLNIRGKRIYDDLMQPKLVDPKQIAYVMPEVLRNSTPETMLDDLKAATSRYPFLRSLVDKLEGKYSTIDKDGQALIYTFFKKARNIYTYAKLEKGGYRTEKANTKAQGNSLTRRMAVNMHGTQLNDWSVYDSTGRIRDDIAEVRDKVLEALKPFDKLGFVNTVEGGYDRRKVFKANGERTKYESLTDYSVHSREAGGAAAIELFLSDNPEFLPDLLKAARGLGLDVTLENLRDAAVAPISKKAAKTLGFRRSTDTFGGNRLQKIVGWVRAAYSEAADQDNGALRYTSATDLYNSFDKNFLNDINYSLGVAFFDELEPRVLSGTSQLGTYTYPNLIHETMDILNNEDHLDEDAYHDALTNNFLRFRGYSLNGKPTGWLKRLFVAPPNVNGRSEEQSPMELYSMTHFNGVDYEKMSLPQKFAAQLSMWGNPLMKAIEVNIMSDYTGAWHFIKNGGIGRQSPRRTELQKEKDARMREALAEYRQETGAEMSFEDRVKVQKELTREIVRDRSFLKKLDGTYRTDWPVVQELVDEVLIEYNIIKQTRLDKEQDPDGVAGPRFRVQDDRGVLFHMFPEFNSIGVESKLDEFLSTDGKAADNDGAEEYLAQLVAEQLQKVIDSDIEYLESIGALKNPILRNTLRDETGAPINLYTKDGKVSSLSVEAQAELEGFFIDTFYGRMQAAKILNGGLQNFEGLLDYEKRNMMLYSPARPVYTEATWHGRKVGRESQRAMYLKDERTASTFFTAADKMLGVLESQGLITSKQRRRMAESYNHITTTDGQAFRTYESYRIVQIELGKWDEERETVYQYLVNDKGNVSKQRIAEELKRIYNPVEKPRYAGWEIIGDRKIPVLHKYSETVLFPADVMERIVGKENVPAQLKGLALAAEALSTKETPFDIFLFESDVKVGCFTSADPFGYVKDEETGEDFIDDDGNKIRNCSTPEEIRDYLYATAQSQPWSIHTLPMKYYGEAASTPAHTEDEEISWSSQAEKDLFGNIFPGDTVVVNGQEISAEDARGIFDDCNAVSVIERFKKLRALFRDGDELRLVLMDELASKSYSNPELEYALSNKRVPLFFPSIRRGAEQIFLSMIKKRLTRPQTKGANILQVTSFGYDFDPFVETWGTNDTHKLRVKTSDTVSDEQMHIEEVEVYITLHDSRLEPFADEYGAISPERLAELVEDGIIPEELLKFVAYRTPSDDIHSIIPCRIKGFLPKTYGANIIMPKEIMNMTGHDFDGDKLRCHFQEFKIDFGQEMDEAYNLETKDDANIIQSVLGQSDKALQRKSEFKKNWAKNINHYKPGTITVYQYDYSKPAYENGQLERNNAKVQLAFGMLTSPAGSRRMVIPGGSPETDVMGAAFEITRKVHDDGTLKDKIAKAFSKVKIDFSNNATTLNSLLNVDGKTLSKILDFINGSVAPFSLKHSLEAYNYIIGGKRMIDIYALHASAALMMQRLGLRMNPITYKSGEKTETIPSIGFFGKPIDALFKVRNNDGGLGSIFMSEAINSAVDNGKNPRLGFLNQCPELAEITAFLSAAGLSMKQIHLVLNQPVVVELVNQMRDTNGSFESVSKKLILELQGESPVFGKYNGHQYAAKKVLGISEDDMAQTMPYHFSELKAGFDEELRGNQIAILRVLRDLYAPAMELTQYVKNTRPEATSSGVGSTIAEMMVITHELQQVRDVVEDEPHISGMADVLAHREAFYDDTTEEIYNKIAPSGLHQVTALQSLMQDQVYLMLSRYFPLAKKSWRSVAEPLAAAYTSATGKLNKSDIQRVADEMVLWNLEHNKGFIGQIEDERKEILSNTPHELMLLKKRIAAEARRRAKGEAAQDKVAALLLDNTFLNHLYVEKPKGPEMKPRISFNKGGASMDNLAEAVTYDWMMLYQMDDQQCKDLAIKLFKYNTFTNGFGYGMYEFAHFAPYPLIEKVPGYLEALVGIQESYDFTTQYTDAVRFLDQHYANHWGDTRLVPRVTEKQLPDAYRVALGLEPLARVMKNGKAIDPNLNSSIVGKPFFVLRKDKQLTLYKVTDLPNNGGISLEEAPKLGVRSERNQVSVQYNPELELVDMVPFQVGLDSVWGDFVNPMDWESDPANLDDTENQAISDEEAANYADSALKYGEQLTSGKYTKRIEKRMATIEDELSAMFKADKKNQKALEQPADVASDEGATAVVDAEQMLADMMKGEQETAEQVKERADSLIRSASEQAEAGEFGPQEQMEFYIASAEMVGKDGGVRIFERKIPNTPENIRLIRRQNAYIQLWSKLTAILADKGIKPGVLARTQAVLEENWGLTNFDAASVAAAGLGELIKLSEDKEKAMIALPEEFAHLALEMLGHDHPLVRRLLNVLENNDEAMKSAYGDTYETYERIYEGDRKKLALEAAGKLVSQSLLMEQEKEIIPETRPLVRRIVDAIKKMLRSIKSWVVGDAILDANNVSSKLARDILNGQLVDMMDLKNVRATGILYHTEKIQVDLTNRKDVLGRILQQETQRLHLLQRRNSQNDSDKRSASEIATEKQINLLERGIREHKLEATLVDYLSNSLQFLRDSEASLEKYVNAGYRPNVICRKLNAIRDTIFSYTNVIEILNQGSANGEYTLSKEIEKAISEVTLEVGRFQQQYERYGMTFFERMLAGIYGEHGITRTLGKHRGEQLTIEEMARKTDRDVNFMNRFLSSLADTGDYVLAAFDFITRQAKVNGRRRTATIVPKLNEAFERLHKETGSRGQSFMFEYEIDKNGNKHRTGKYISAEEAEKLSPAQKHFYDTVMEIKHEVDRCLPPHAVKDPRQIICLRKYGFDRIASADGISDKWHAFTENVRNSVLDTSDNIEYEKQEVIKDFEGNRIDMLPIHYTNKGKNESWDDMTEDVAQSVLAYAGMGFEYNELNGVVALLENARYMSMKREVVQRSGIREQVQKVVARLDDKNYIFEKPHTKKQVVTNIQLILNDFFQMQVYGRLQKEEGTFGHTRVSKRKVANIANAIASYNQMALNWAQRISNVTAGMSNILIETAGKGVFNAGDFSWGLKEYLGNTVNRMFDTGKTESDNKLSLFAERFDLHQNNGKKPKNYSKSGISRVINTNLLFAGLNAGEDMLALTTALAIARRHKVKTADGKTSNLWEAYEVKYADPKNKRGAYLEVKNGWTEMDGKPISHEDEDEYARLVIGTNFRLQGIYNNDDKAAIQQYALGSLAMMYRKWIHPAIKRRYGGAGYNPLTGTEGEGYWTTFWNWATGTIREVSDEARQRANTETAMNLFEMTKGIGASLVMNYKNLTEYEKSNMHRALTELGILLSVTLAIGLLDALPPDDDKGLESWAENMLVYQLYRARNEIGSVAPTPLIMKEINNTISSPIAAWKPVQNIVQAPFILLPSNWVAEIKSGPYKGHSRAYKMLMDLPVLAMWKQFEHFKDPSSLINYYKAGF